MSNPYDRAKFVVETNARKQALGDASTLEHSRIMEALDPAAPAELMRNLLNWVRTPKGQMVFRGLAQPDYHALTQLEKFELQDYWVERYIQIVREKLTERVKGNV
jgi:hypothetical protein